MSGEGRGGLVLTKQGCQIFLIKYHLLYVFQCVFFCVMPAYQHISSVQKAF